MNPPAQAPAVAPAPELRAGRTPDVPARADAPTFAPAPPAAAPPRPVRAARPAGADEVFLRAQETMRRFLESQEAILAAYFGAEPAVPRIAEARPARIPEAAFAPAPGPAAEPPATPVPAAHEVPEPVAAAPARPAPPSREVALIEIVANRTGYPPDMLDPDADMEADLGIDSIKRVEIIAAFRRAVLPEMAQPTPAFMDAMTGARSMNDILRAIREFAPASAPAPQAAAPARHAAPPAGGPPPADVRAELVRIVAERTGYPADMLDPGADMEADLGIDSIKRVEIIAAFRRAVLPGMAQPTPAFMDAMTGARSMDEILAAVRSFTGAPAHAGPAPAAAVADAAAPPAAPRTEVAIDAREELVRIVAQRTGYPPDMLDPDADLEADLGIDSIKRVEIVAAFRRSVLPEMKEPTPAFADALSGATTMRAILDALTRFLEPEPAPPAKPRRTPRCVVRSVEIPGAGREVRPPAGGVVLITDDGCGASKALADRLGGHGARGVVLALKSLESASAVAAAVEAARAAGPIVGAVHLAPMRHAADFADCSRIQWLQGEREELLSLLFLAQALAPELQASSGGAFLLAAVTAGGGDFDPRSATDATAPWRGGIAGFLKCAALEWPGARVRALDVADAPNEEMCRILFEEWGEPGPVEVGYRGRTRLGLRAVEAPLDSAPAETDPGLDERSVVLVTGGARGITAEAVKELARQTRATFVLVARTPMPEGDESPETAPARSAQELRGIVATAMRQEQPRVTPREVEARVQSLLRAREVRGTLAAVRDAGARAEYVSCDVADSEAFGAVIADVVRRHSRIDALIHGAGAIEDRLIVDKTEDSFQRVLRTKIDPLLTLFAAVPREHLRLLIVFSSVAGFFGNRGQSDYAAANEVLNRLAELMRRHWGIKVASLNWGPWEGTGMVTEEVAEQFRSRGIDLVTVEEGRRAVWDEVRQASGEDVRVVLGPGPWVTDAAGTPRPRPAGRPQPTRRPGLSAPPPASGS
jgi:NAD(P)-dependent dehydrogenase (short-subunit alcohol dehydrogenase family)/acyl carrier protein